MQRRQRLTFQYVSHRLYSRKTLFLYSKYRGFSVVQQFYESRVIDEFVLRGNTATLKCLLPSFVADFVDVIEWVSTEDGTSYMANNHEEKGTLKNSRFILLSAFYTYFGRPKIMNERASSSGQRLL